MKKYLLTALTILPIIALAKPATIPLQIHSQDKSILVHVELAKTVAERAKGLMHRQSLKADHGMLFVFPKSQYMHFWMKNTLMPLDILYINKDKQIVEIQTMQPCQKTPCIRYSSALPAQYGLELNAGFTKAHGIKPGDWVSLPSSLRGIHPASSLRGTQ